MPPLPAPALLMVQATRALRVLHSTARGASGWGPTRPAGAAGVSAGRGRQDPCRSPLSPGLGRSPRRQPAGPGAAAVLVGGNWGPCPWPQAPAPPHTVGAGLGPWPRQGLADGRGRIPGAGRASGAGPGPAGAAGARARRRALRAGRRPPKPAAAAGHARELPGRQALEQGRVVTVASVGHAPGRRAPPTPGREPPGPGRVASARPPRGAQVTCCRVPRAIGGPGRGPGAWGGAGPRQGGRYASGAAAP